jgi:hypothetical protein
MRSLDVEVRPSTAPAPGSFSGTAVEPFNQESWDRWRAKGRAADVAFASSARTIALAAGTIVALAAAMWTAQ